MTLPPAFLASLPDTEAFIRYRESLKDPLVTSIRLNPGKKAPGWLNGMQYERVPWCENGILLPQRPDFTRDPAFHQGRYYVQEAASMFLYHAVYQLATKFKVHNVLDACAAPGGKTTAACDALMAAGKPFSLLANEADPLRAVALQENVIKHGTGKIDVTVGKAQRFENVPEYFDLILADAPCSGEGMMRKEPVAVSQWSPALVEQCSKVQREIVQALYTALRPGGIMIYSTCTFNTQENEDIIHFLTNDLGAESIPIPGVDKAWNIQPGIGTKEHCYRFIPGSTLGEGLFMSVVQKPIAASPQPSAVRPKNISFPVMKGLKSQKDIPGYPSQQEILRGDFLSNEFPACEVDKATAIDYLRGNAIRIEAPKGAVLLTYEDQPLGMVKNIGSRANNLYPRQLRIRSSY